MSYPKRLIEVDLPIKRISAHASREKSIRHGHISTLHIWWARRPLAACRAVICATLWPDPADPACPQVFRDKATQAITKFAAKATTSRLIETCSPESIKQWMNFGRRSPALNPISCEDLLTLRNALLDFIADFANWDNSTKKEYLEAARTLTEAAHEALVDKTGTRPLVVDPFAGGGSIPLEALRVGANAFASDLNPVAVMLNRVLTEYIPSYGSHLAEDVLRWGVWVKKEVEKDLARFYPRTPILPQDSQNRPVLLIDILDKGAAPIAVNDARGYITSTGKSFTHYVPLKQVKDHKQAAFVNGLNSVSHDSSQRDAYLESIGARPLLLQWETTIAYIWARTIKCEGPNCGVEYPLVRSLWLAKKDNRSVALLIVPKKRQKRVELDIIERKGSKWIRQGRPSEEISNPIFAGTIKRGSATCPCCGYTTAAEKVREQLRTRAGGSKDARMMVVVKEHPKKGTIYDLPSQADIDASVNASLFLKSLENNTTLRGNHFTPDEPVPSNESHRSVASLWIYGMKEWRDIYTDRQLLFLGKLCEKLLEAPLHGIPSQVHLLLSLCVGKVADYLSTLCLWRTARTCVAHTFGRQALPIVWDFGEMNPFAGSAGDWSEAVNYLLLLIDNIQKSVILGAETSSQQADATMHPLPDDAADIFATDPPYYDSVVYAELSDYFYVWLKRAVPQELSYLFSDHLTPKEREAVVYHPHSREERRNYELLMSTALSEGRRILKPEGIGVVVFAHKSTSGWETMLQALIRAGWTVSASWPIDTERGGRMNAFETASLASSVHLICRPREDSNGTIRTDDVGDWRGVLAQLPMRIHDWMPRLAQEGVVGADAIFACLGPALEIFSRYSSVEKASGEQVTLKEYLEHVWAAVAKEALNMIFEGGDTTGFEEDARLTAMWLWTLKTEDSSAATNIVEEDLSTEEEEGVDSRKQSLGGYVLEYDAARKIAQGLGAHLERLESLVEIKGEKAKLLSLEERARFLFSRDSLEVSPRRKGQTHQPTFFEIVEAGEKDEREMDKAAPSKRTETVLDCVHKSMLLFAANRSEALRKFLLEDGIGKDERFWKLSQSLVALYPKGSNEKRWVEGVMAKKKSLGF